MNKSKQSLPNVPGAGHRESNYTEPANYEQAALQFWKEFDREMEEEP